MKHFFFFLEDENDSSSDESSPPDSPVPYLSRNKQNPFPLTPLSTNIPSTSIIPSSVSTRMPASTPNTPTVNTTGTYHLKLLTSS